MARKRNNLLDFLAYLLMRTAETVLLVGGWPMAYGLARAAAWVLWKVDRRHTRRALGHLERSFPHWPEARRRHVARESIRHMVCMGMESLLTTRLIRVYTYKRYIRLVNMGGAIRLMVDRNRPVILVTGHFGNWEVAGYVAAAVGLPTATVARHIDNPFVHEHILGVRQRHGQRIIDKKGAAGPAAEVMEANGGLTLAGDQDGGRRGVFVDFFGRPASTYKSIALLAMAYEAPICVIYSLRKGEEYRFDMGCCRIIRPEEWAGRADAMRWITREYTQAIEQVARREPEQYFWVHRRWKNRPPGEERGPDGIA